MLIYVPVQFLIREKTGKPFTVTNETKGRVMNNLYNTHNHKRKWKYNGLYNSGNVTFITV